MSDDNAGKPTRLEEEGEITADYLEELFDIVDLDGDTEINVESSRASVEIVVDDLDVLDRLVGDDGEALGVPQELTRLAVQTETGERPRPMLDTAGSRVEHKEELQNITREAIARVRATGEAVKFDVMDSLERRVCHDVVADEGLTSESEGAKPHRRVAILPENTDGE